MLNEKQRKEFSHERFGVKKVKRSIMTVADTLKQVRRDENRLVAYGICTLPNNRLAVAHSRSRVSIFNTNNLVEALCSVGDKQFRGTWDVIYCQSTDELIVSDYGNNRLQIFDTELKQRRCIQFDQDFRPLFLFSLALDETHNRIFVTLSKNLSNCASGKG